MRGAGAIVSCTSLDGSNTTYVGPEMCIIKTVTIQNCCDQIIVDATEKYAVHYTDAGALPVIIQVSWPHELRPFDYCDRCEGDSAIKIMNMRISGVKRFKLAQNGQADTPQG